MYDIENDVKDGTYKKICPVCNRQFRTNKKDKIYCCKEHNRMANNKKYYRKKNSIVLKPKKCITCGKIFMPKQERSMCCCRKCAKKAYEIGLFEDYKYEEKLIKLSKKKKKELSQMKKTVLEYINKSKDLRELSFKSDVGLSILESIKMGLYGITDKVVERCYDVLKQIEG